MGGAAFERVAWATRPAQRARGLLGLERVERGFAMAFPRCASVHTWFMRCPIDVVYLDREWRVLGTETLGPWKVGRAPRGTRNVVECAAGEAARLGIGPGVLLSVGRPE